MTGSPIEEIKNRLDIVEVVQNYIRLHKAGINYRANCPFHSEKKPSFFVSPSRQSWHCFGSCGEGGDIFKFVMKIENIEFGDALRILAQKAGVELRREDPKIKTERQRLYEINELACRFFEKQLELSNAGAEVVKYLKDRGVTDETIKKWRLGYSPDTWGGLSDFLTGHGYTRQEAEKAGLSIKSSKSGNYFDRFRGRIMFPISDFNSQVIAFGGRVFKNLKRPDGQEEAKYMNTPATILYDKSRALYGLNRGGLSIRKKDFFIMVEGYVDAIMAHQAGYDNAVAPCGTALTPRQLGILKRYSENMYTAFDMDVAGDSATKRGIELAQALGFNIKVVLLSQGKDPADLILADSSLFEQSIKTAKTIYDFYFDGALGRFDKATLEGKKSISRALLPIIKRIPNKIEQNVWVQGLASAIRVSEDNVWEELKKTKIEGSRLDIEKTPEISKDDITNGKRGRRELLEERLLLLLAKHPKGLETMGEKDFSFFSPGAVCALNYFRQKGIKIAEAPEANSDFINFLIMKAESTVAGEPDEIREEFGHCLFEFRRMAVKTRLAELAEEIKAAESENNPEKLSALLAEFSALSKSRCDLESA